MLQATKEGFIWLIVLSQHALEKANEKISDYVNSTDAELTRLNTENQYACSAMHEDPTSADGFLALSRLRNERRALQALLKRQASTG